ncbi:MAG: vanadium-dependent haloperoxidase [Bryobacteraceae bacterium]|nr:vanadium-dependent haloperoxidase [Bryobacteraceae bacterium]
MVIPAVVPFIFSDIAPSGMDATLVVRATTLITNSWFDATAPYHPTAQGVYSRLGRRPANENTTRNLNIACLYASYRVLNSILPKRNPEWRAMLQSVGLDPDDSSESTSSPAGLGNLAGKAIVAFRERDGMNQLGDEGRVKYNRIPYSDYTGYEPANTAYDLRDPSRWQPRVVPVRNGIFRVQQFVTPQYAETKPYSYNTPNRFQTPRPDASNPRGPRGHQAYKAQADEVLMASANLTDHKKLMAEMFDNKINSLGFSAVFAALSRGLSLMEFIHLDFLTNLAAFDTGIAVWKEKARWDAVRPFSAIQYLYGNRPVTAWGGPGKGTVNDLPANQWKEYLNVADHPEYPSGSAAFCAAHAQSARRFLGSDQLNWSVPVPKGSSIIEPGVTPANDIVLGPWPTWTAFEQDCGMSRLWGGVHFRDAIEAGTPLGREIGNLAYEFLKRHIDGNAPPAPTP